MWSEDGRVVTLSADDLVQTENQFIANEDLEDDEIIDAYIEEHIGYITRRIFKEMVAKVKAEVTRSGRNE